MQIYKLCTYVAASLHLLQPVPFLQALVYTASAMKKCNLVTVLSIIHFPLRFSCRTERTSNTDSTWQWCRLCHGGQYYHRWQKYMQVFRHWRGKWVCMYVVMLHLWVRQKYTILQNQAYLCDLQSASESSSVCQLYVHNFASEHFCGVCGLNYLS